MMMIVIIVTSKGLSGISDDQGPVVDDLLRLQAGISRRLMYYFTHSYTGLLGYTLSQPIFFIVLCCFSGQPKHCWE